jgi:hypothetical protein
MNAVECLRAQASPPSGPDDYTLAPISAVRIERAAYRVPRSEVSARQRYWEPVSGFEPLTVRLQEVRLQALGPLPAPMPHKSAITAPKTLGFLALPFHDPFHECRLEQTAASARASASSRCLPKLSRTTLHVVCGGSLRG